MGNQTKQGCRFFFQKACSWFISKNINKFKSTHFDTLFFDSFDYLYTYKKSVCSKLAIVDLNRVKQWTLLMLRHAPCKRCSVRSSKQHSTKTWSFIWPVRSFKGYVWYCHLVKYKSCYSFDCCSISLVAKSHCVLLMKRDLGVGSYIHELWFHSSSPIWRTFQHFHWLSWFQ